MVNKQGKQSKHVGVHFYGERWAARIWVNGEPKHLGLFNTEEEARLAYVEEASKHVDAIVDLNGEKWADVFGYDGYKISNKGRIKSLSFKGSGIEGLLKQRPLPNGYLKVCLSGGKHLTIHRLVWEAFNGEIDKGKHINHLNRDKTDNRLENLEVCYPRENQSHYMKDDGGSFMGCHYNKEKGKWVAQISVNGKQKYLGAYHTKEEAHEVYLKEVNRIGEENKYA